MLDSLGPSAVFVGCAAILLIVALDVALLGPRSTSLNLETSSDDTPAPRTGRFDRQTEREWTSTT